MTFVEIIFILDSISVIMQSIIIFSSALKSIKHKNLYILSKRNRLILLVSVLLPMIVFDVGYLLTNKAELNIDLVLHSILSGIVNTWGVAIPVPSISFLALIIDSQNRKKQ